MEYIIGLKLYNKHTKYSSESTKSSVVSESKHDDLSVIMNQIDELQREIDPLINISGNHMIELLM
jgi:hypothetical protein